MTQSVIYNIENYTNTFADNMVSVKSNIDCPEKQNFSKLVDNINAKTNQFQKNIESKTAKSNTSSINKKALNSNNSANTSLKINSKKTDIKIKNKINSNGNISSKNGFKSNIENKIQNKSIKNFENNTQINSNIENKNINAEKDFNVSSIDELSNINNSSPVSPSPVIFFKNSQQVSDVEIQDNQAPNLENDTDIVEANVQNINLTIDVKTDNSLDEALSKIDEFALNSNIDENTLNTIKEISSILEDTDLAKENQEKLDNLISEIRDYINSKNETQQSDSTVDTKNQTDNIKETVNTKDIIDNNVIENNIKDNIKSVLSEVILSQDETNNQDMIADISENLKKDVVLENNNLDSNELNKATDGNKTEYLQPKKTEQSILEVSIQGNKQQLYISQNDSNKISDNTVLSDAQNQQALKPQETDNNQNISLTDKTQPVQSDIESITNNAEIPEEKQINTIVFDKETDDFKMSDDKNSITDDKISSSDVLQKTTDDNSEINKISSNTSNNKTIIKLQDESKNNNNDKVAEDSTNKSESVLNKILSVLNSASKEEVNIQNAIDNNTQEKNKTILQDSTKISATNNSTLKSDNYSNGYQNNNDSNYKQDVENFDIKNQSTDLNSNIKTDSKIDLKADIKNLNDEDNEVQEEIDMEEPEPMVAQVNKNNNINLDKKSVLKNIFTKENLSQMESIEFNSDLTESGALSVSDEVAKLAINTKITNNEMLPLNHNENIIKNISFEKTIQQSQNIQSKLESSDIFNQISEKLQSVDNGASQRLTLVLRPNDLGRLSIELTTNEKGLTTNILVQNSDVRKFIEKNIDSLRQQLVNAGVNVNTIQIKTAGEAGTLSYSGNQNSQNGESDLNDNQYHNQQQDNNKKNKNDNKFNLDYDSYFSKNTKDDFSSVLNNTFNYMLS